MSIELTPFGKINLGLRILGHREDGYHDLITVFQRISLSDKVILEKMKGRIEYDGPELTVSPEDNLCWRAAAEFMTCFGVDMGVRIHLEKKIPTGAGIGGGSSDAAAVLRGMAMLYGIPAHHEALSRAAWGVGSDVPFFLEDVPAALARGRGEKLKRVKGLSDEIRVVILKPDFAVSTSRAYSLLDDCLTFDEKNVKIKVREFLTYTGGKPTAQMTNDFEGPVFSVHPELAEARDRLLSSGAAFAGLCGSGSALFAVFEDETRGREVADRWCSPWLSYYCRIC